MCATCVVIFLESKTTIYDQFEFVLLCAFTIIFRDTRGETIEQAGFLDWRIGLSNQSESCTGERKTASERVQVKQQTEKRLEHVSIRQEYVPSPPVHAFQTQLTTNPPIQAQHGKTK